MSGACLLSAYGLMSLGKSTMRVQADVKQQQETINRMVQIQEPARTLLRDIGEMSLTNKDMQALLARNGYTVKVATASNSVPQAAAK